MPTAAAATATTATRILRAFILLVSWSSSTKAPAPGLETDGQYWYCATYRQAGVRAPRGSCVRERQVRTCRYLSTGNGRARLLAIGILFYYVQQQGRTMERGLRPI